MMTETPYIDKFTVNLSKKVDENRDRYRAFERENETRQLRTILNQERKNSAALIGEAGVGKTAVVNGLAVQLLEDTIQDDISGRQILLLTLPLLMENSDGQSFATNLQHLLDELIAHQSEYILFIDEMHQLVGTGSAEGSMMDAANILKPAIGQGEINIIGATTLEEFHLTVETDNAMDRRFDKVSIEETNQEQTMAILRKVAASYLDRKQMTITDEQLAFVYRLSSRFMTTQFFPEKAIMLLDSAVTIARMNGESVVTNEHIAQKIQDQYHVPMPVLLENESDRILALPEVLESRVLGQEDALKKIIRRIRSRSAGLSNTNKPLSFLLAGPTGVGKTETAKALAEGLFGSEEDMIRFDMSEFMFAQASKEIFQERLTEAVKFHPYSVLLLDEIEKADPLVLDLLLQVLDDGRLTNKLGRTINFKDLVVIMTSNLGHDAIEEFNANTDVYKEDRKNQQTFLLNFESILRGSGMRREFIKRIGSIVIFNPLDDESILKIIDMKLEKLGRAARQKGYKIIHKPEDIERLLPTFKERFEMVPTQVNGQIEKERIDAYPIREFIKDKGYKSTDGARPLDDAINEYVEDVVAEAILEEQLSGHTEGHTFIFRAHGQAPDATHAFGTWKSVVSQVEQEERYYG